MARLTMQLMSAMHFSIYATNILEVGAVTVTQIDLDDDALQQAMALSGTRTKKEAVNLALRYYAEQQQRAARLTRHLERARSWEAVRHADELHRKEKAARDR